MDSEYQEANDVVTNPAEPIVNAAYDEVATAAKLNSTTESDYDVSASAPPSYDVIPDSKVHVFKPTPEPNYDDANGLYNNIESISNTNRLSLRDAPTYEIPVVTSGGGGVYEVPVIHSPISVATNPNQYATNDVLIPQSAYSEVEDTTRSQRGSNVSVETKRLSQMSQQTRFSDDSNKTKRLSSVSNATKFSEGRVSDTEPLYDTEGLPASDTMYEN